MKLFNFPILINNIIDKQGKNSEIFGKNTNNFKNNDISLIRIKNIPNRLN
jgi:hypothetical protein